MERLFALVVAMLFLCLTSFACGASFAVHLQGEDPNKLLIPTLTMFSGWASGIGTFIAAFVALHISRKQSAEARAHDAERCIHHAMAVANDLRSRVHYFERTLVCGGRPLAALTRNADAIARRYESLYDRDLYRHLPGPVVDSITAMSGKFFALDTWVTAQTSALAGKQHIVLPDRRGELGEEAGELRKLMRELDNLFTELEKLAREIER